MSTLLGAGLAGGFALTAPVAVADEGLSETSHSRFVFDQDSTEVEATVTLTLRNDTPDRRTSDTIYSYYWNAYGIPVPASAKDLRATSGGASLRVTTEPTDDPNTTLATAHFSPLNYGRTRTIEWTYTIPGEPIRSEGYTRVGPGYATFAAQGVGDPGQITVEVVLPSSMSFDSSSDIFTEKRISGTATYTATGTEDDYVWAFVSARDPEQVDERTVEVGDLSLTLQSFPGDDAWSDFVADQVTAGLPVLEEVVGMPWPGGLETIREDVSPQVLGYAWYDPSKGEIVVAEDFDEQLLFHELGHVWFNGLHFDGRWLSEGLTELVALRVVERMEGAADPRKTPQRDARHALPLLDWSDGWDHDVDEYGYAASFAAVSALVGDLDDETFADIISAAYAGESAYEAAGTTDQGRGRTDWRRFLDLLEDRAGVEDAEDVYRAWVVDADEHERLDARSASRLAYAAIDQADGDWQPPQRLRASMTHWRFANADTAMAALGAAPDAAAAVQQAAEDAGLPEPTAARDAYEGARDEDELAALAEHLERTVEVVEQVGEASKSVAAESDPFTELGERLLDVKTLAADARADLDAGQLDSAAALAEDVTSRAGLALWLGLGVVVLPILLLGGIVLLVVRLRRRRRATARAATAATAPDEALGTDSADEQPEQESRSESRSDA